MIKRTVIKLDCGVSAEQWFNRKDRWLSISLSDLYDGDGELNSLELLGKLFTELAQKGFKSKGLMTKKGYYDSIDDIILNVVLKYE